MKKIFFLFLILLIPVLSHSQIKSANLGLYGGILLPMGDFSNSFNISPSAGIEGFYPVNADVDFVADISYNFLTSKLNIPNTNYYFLESAAGIRYNLTPTKQKFFIEAEVGAYTYGNHYSDNSGSSYNYSKSYFGFNLGVGALIPVSNKFAITGKAKYHDVFSDGNFSPSGSYSNYVTITAGITFSLK